jgi:hypothetical protein
MSYIARKVMANGFKTKTGFVSIAGTTKIYIIVPIPFL